MFGPAVTDWPLLPISTSLNTVWAVTSLKENTFGHEQRWQPETHTRRRNASQISHLKNGARFTKMIRSNDTAAPEPELMCSQLRDQ